MTKLEQFNIVLDTLKKHNASQKLTDALSELLKPGKGGQRVNLEEITKVDESGAITELQCRLSGVWLPANELNFYPEADSKIVANGIGLSRTSRQAKKIVNDFNAMKKATKNAIVADLLEGAIDKDKANELIANIPTEADYSTVTPTVEVEPEA